MNLSSISKIIDKIKNKKKVLLNKNPIVVLATGVFDLLHKEHISFLIKAKEHGDILIVGIESDQRVKKLKGKSRPINNQENRLKIITNLKNTNKKNIADFTFILPNNLDTKKGREALIDNLRPNIYAISQNSPFKKEKKRIIEKFKGRLKVVHFHNPNISTTKLINKAKLISK